MFVKLIHVDARTSDLFLLIAIALHECAMTCSRIFLLTHVWVFISLWLL